ncbi:hypothetical protein P691DRAFT_789402 [Macrolepiota fuliginosa MF-IS2]|uniref:Uncharacterized protein n=1 Tax=Macrolepiota fuliginosa MF-IS2 TaxID=1400762 RepID=A0A9P5X0P4_9AGAR|nr:hypothetical protein P691DRAFT_789402 [Macrolepiota fuliginosa MF-IS2]
MSDFGLVLGDFAYDLMNVRQNGYASYTAFALFIYDSLCTFSREKAMVHNSSYIPAALYLYVHDADSPKQTLYLDQCDMFIWTGTVVCAIWDYNFKVTVMLIFITAAEIIIGLVRGIANGIITSQNKIEGFPLHGCFRNDLSLSQSHLLASADIAIGIARFGAAAIELLLILIRLFQALRQAKLVGNTFYARIVHIKKFTPILYIFYRDGTLLILPLPVIVTLHFLAALETDSSQIALLEKLPENITAWFALVYYLCATRLILNLREANCKMTETMLSRRHTTIRFNHNTQHNSDGTIDEDEGIIEEIRH